MTALIQKDSALKAILANCLMPMDIIFIQGLTLKALIVTVTT